jgi:hypothetical protein
MRKNMDEKASKINKLKCYEQLAFNQLVAGSNPTTPATNSLKYNNKILETGVFSGLVSEYQAAT